ncbi:MAG TPA: Maf family protein [Phycisphaerae bacterium]|nr:Maf family protein [Phycisphaerae bacterium]
MNERKIVLASQSPRRRELLRDAGIEFETVPPRYDEPDPASWPSDPICYVETVSIAKARSVAEDHPDRVILGADTVVALENRMFGKPMDETDARRILCGLFGTTHRVITGVALHEPAGGRQIIRHATTRCRMRPMSPAELDEYLRGGAWEGKAGAYGIQDEGDEFVTIVEGSFSNVVGLPIELVVEMLADFGVRPGRGGLAG